MGGTKTEAIAFDKDGNELVRATSGFGNILIDFEEALCILWKQLINARRV